MCACVCVCVCVFFFFAAAEHSYYCEIVVINGGKIASRIGSLLCVAFHGIFFSSSLTFFVLHLPIQYFTFLLLLVKKKNLYHMLLANHNTQPKPTCLANQREQNKANRWFVHVFPRLAAVTRAFPRLAPATCYLFEF